MLSNSWLPYISGCLPIIFYEHTMSVPVCIYLHAISVPVHAYYMHIRRSISNVVFVCCHTVFIPICIDTRCMCLCALTFQWIHFLIVYWHTMYVSLYRDTISLLAHHVYPYTQITPKTHTHTQNNKTLQTAPRLFNKGIPTEEPPSNLDIFVHPNLAISVHPILDNFDRPFPADCCI